MPKTLLEKIWDEHVVLSEPDCPSVLYVDLQLLHEVTSPQAFASLRARGLKVRRPDRAAATIDHVMPTHNPKLGILDPQARDLVAQIERNCRDFGIALHGVGDPHQGVIHVMGPELGLTRPGMTIVCGDSHTATHGAFGALAFGIGTSEVEHVLATQTLLQRKPKTFEVRVEGKLPRGVSAKDVILAFIARVGVGGATGHAIEYRGTTIRALSMEERMTVCNMTIEAGARSGMVGADETTLDYLKGRPFALQSLDALRKYATDEGASFDKSLAMEAEKLEPYVTYGTNPGAGMPVAGTIPAGADPKMLRYMGLEAGAKLLGHPVDAVFVGSCTNGRIEDLRAAASVLKGRRVKAKRVMIVPGSGGVKRQAEAEGLHRIFLEAGCEWREPGCSMCLAMNGDEIGEGEYCVSTSNRNFEGRQGKGGRTFLASPLTAAASAVEGRVADPRIYL